MNTLNILGIENTLRSPIALSTHKLESQLIPLFPDLDSPADIYAPVKTLLRDRYDRAAREIGLSYDTSCRQSTRTWHVPERVVENNARDPNDQELDREYLV